MHLLLLSYSGIVRSMANRDESGTALQSIWQQVSSDAGRVRGIARHFVRALYGHRKTGFCFLLLGTFCCGGGRPAGQWRAEFFDNIDFAGKPHHLAYHRVVDFNWGMKAPLPSWRADNFAIRWDTCVSVKSSTRVTFRLGSDDGSRLYVDGAQIIDNWARQPFVVVTRTTILSPGTHHLRVEYFDAGRDARIQLTTTVRPASSALDFTLVADASQETLPCEAIRTSTR